MLLRSFLTALRHGPTRLALAATLALALSIGLSPASAGTSTASSTSMQCKDSMVPISLAPGLPDTERIFVHLCLPAGKTPSAVQFLTHGFAYDHQYWDFPDPTGNTSRYSYVSSAIKTGYATLSYDRLGIGRSSHPLSALVTFDANVWVAHQLVQALRAGDIAGPNGQASFSKVVAVGHSYGTWFTWFEASRYHDVDAVILTGATHKLAFDSVAAKAVFNTYPATLDPKFPNLDPGYLTTKPGARYQTFYAPAPADPAVVAYDEANKQTGTVSELAHRPLILTTPLDIRVPALVILGSVDTLFCKSASALPTATDCSSTEAMVGPERSQLGPNIPSVDGYLLPGAGHDLNLMYNATDWFKFSQTWLTAKVSAT